MDFLQIRTTAWIYITHYQNVNIITQHFNN